MNANRVMAIVATLFVVALVLGANFAQFKTLESTLSAQAGDDAFAIGSRIVKSVPDIRRLTRTGTASTEQLQLLANTIGDQGQITALFFDADGLLRASAGPVTWKRHPEWDARIETLVQTSLATGSVQKGIFTKPWTIMEPLLFGAAIFPIPGVTERTEGVVVTILNRSGSATVFHDAFIRLSLVLSVVFSLAFALISAGFFLMRRQASASRQQINYLAHFDQLTGLYNRGGFRSELNKLKRAGILTCERAAIVYIDLDNFKAINDSRGHGAGDAVLRHVGQAVRNCLGPNDIGVRYGGDEFVVICQVETTADAVALAERIRAAVARPVAADRAPITAQASCGICMGTQCGADVDVGLHHADLALYQAKLDGRNTCREYTPELESRIKRRIKIEDAVRNGLQNQAFELFYQPLIHAKTQQCVGFEALLRLTDTDGVPLSPSEFIPIAEASGQIGQIGHWVLATAAAEAQTWPDHLFVSVNLSARQFDKDNLVAIVSETLSHSGLAPHRLELEVTESLLIQNAESVGRQLSALRGLGVSIAMDDFGTGYSSLGYLWRYGFDKLKIDRSFVIGLDRDAQRSTEIIDTIIVLAHRLDMNVTVEGIETEAQARIVSRLGCDQMQGYLFGRAMPAGDLPAYLLGSIAESGATPRRTRSTRRRVRTA